MITSPANNRIKRAVRLRRGAHRRDEGLTLVDGVREVGAAADAGVAFRELFFCRDLLDNRTINELLAKVEQRGGEILEVAPAVADRLAYGERHDGITAVVVPPKTTLGQLALPDCPLIAVLEGVEKPGNLGAVVRSADVAGVSAIIVADGGTDLYNPNAIRASLGTIFQMSICAAQSKTILEWLRGQQMQIIAARVDGSAAPWEVDLALPTAIVLGAEATGLSTAWNAADVHAVRLPMHGHADSLNVSAAAAVLFYEALRQRV